MREKILNTIVSKEFIYLTFTLNVILCALLADDYRVKGDPISLAGVICCFTAYTLIALEMQFGE